MNQGKVDELEKPPLVSIKIISIKLENVLTYISSSNKTPQKYPIESPTICINIMPDTNKR
jgi:hypothetical protein